MIERLSKISSKNQVTLPADVRGRLGVGATDKIAFVIDDQGVHVRSAKRSLAELSGSIPPLPGESPDLRREIGEAMDAEADRITRELHGS